ncbi:T9SS type A sorting domain-containing protein [Dyadobacter sandarakinus]|uniref:T9SS type A sorting domain-containing protein n=1 Tax=Dyadobacter sandarakinus TaxID=2747268 RepID=A0ABX7I466_9BACT|nr:T9SS type A sorting domain-containing protein [Dyadobacter sandarakinus]QRR00886.1 T9SS type A sorting domain-containing protein [Dyadobacter sandarakinus]
MKYILLNVTIFFLSITSLIAQPIIEWEKIINAPNNGYTYMWVVKETPDGGYIIGGQADGGIGGDKTAPNKGKTDYWVIKLKEDRSVEWDKTYGGTANDQLWDIVLTPDGGYLLAGDSNSDAGFDKSEDCKSQPTEDGLPPNYWLVKITADGEKQWDKTYGGPDGNYFETIQPTVDGGYVLAGSSNGYNVFKLSQDGFVEWEKRYTGQSRTSISSLKMIRQTADKGFVMAGLSNADVGNDKSQPSRGNDDYWIIKTDSTGAVLWDKVYGGSRTDQARDVTILSNGSYLITGTSNSPKSGEKSEGLSSKYGPDPWILLLNPDGELLWENTVGANGPLFFYEEQKNRNVVLAGRSGPNPDKTEKTSGAWMVTLDTTGMIVSDLSLSYNEFGDYHFVKTSDGGFLLYNYIYKITKYSSPPPPLPVKLNAFDIINENATAILQWQTTSETRSDHFEVEHSTNAKTWNRIAIVNANRESNALQSYQFIHTSPVKGDNYYRLKMADTDGTYAYSSIEQVKFEFDFDISVYPNPAAETIHLEAADWSKVKGLQILNSQGGTLYSAGNKPPQNINAKLLRPGLYFIKFTFVDGTETIRKIAVGQ